MAVLISAALLTSCGADEETETDTEVLTDEDTVTQTETDTEVDTETETETETTQAGGGGGGDGDGGPTGTRGCGDVAFAQNTDHGAFRIRARNVSCQVARAVARDSHNSGRRYDSRGFTCWGDPQGGELPSTQFDCKRGNEGVSFSRS